MNDLNERETAWRQRVEQLLESAEAETETLLKAIHDGAYLRRERLESAEDPASVRTLALDEPLCRLQAESSRLLVADPAPASVAPLVDRWLKSEDAYLTQLLTRPDLDPLRRSLLLEQFRRDLNSLSEIVSRLEGIEAPHPSVAARRELERLLIHTREAPDDRRQPIEADADRLRRALLDARLEHLLRLDPDSSDAVELWRRRFVLSRLEAEVEALGPPPPAAAAEAAEPDPRARLPQLGERRRQLAQVARQRLDALEPQQRLDAWHELLNLARGESNETLSVLEELPNHQAARLLEHAHEDIIRIRDEARADVEALKERPTAGDARREIARVARRLNRLARATRGELQEQELEARLIALFGRRFPKFLDNLVLVLILVLAVLIVVEMFMAQAGTLSPGLERIFAWADLGICAVFLFEFFLKLGLARGKPLYLMRHSLIDLLPSIPFGYLAFTLSGATHINNVQLLLLRAPRFVRFIRLMRPFVRFLRVFFFIFRFTDRLVRRYAYVFNRNIILFEPKSVDDRESRGGHALYNLRRHFEKRAPEHLDALPAEQRPLLAAAGIAELRHQLCSMRDVDVGIPFDERPPAEARDITAEEVVERLIEMTPEELVETMGPAFANSIDRYIGFLDAPILRRLPVLSDLVLYRSKGPAEAAALAANYLGVALQWALDIVYYVADLQATVSPSLFLDKLGRTIVNATKRPARRLFTFGLSFAALWAIAYLAFPPSEPAAAAPRNARDVAAADLFAMPVALSAAATTAGSVPDGLSTALGPVLVYETESAALRLLVEGESIGLLRRIGRWLRAALGWIGEKLGLPVILIGVICFVLMRLGAWFQKIANQASEFNDRIVEAQFAAQTKALKGRNRDRDLKFLAERVTVPEIRLRSCDDLPALGHHEFWSEEAEAASDRAEAKPEAGDDGFSGSPAEETAPPRLGGTALLDGRELGLGREVSLKASESAFLYTLKLLYEDYRDGSPFHRNDTKASTQLLGNLALRNLSRSNLPYFLFQGKRLRRLDLSRAEASLLSGPHMWFDYITRMIVQETGTLLIDYNRHALPLDRLACGPRRVRETYRRWLAGRLKVDPATIELPEPVGRFGDAELPSSGVPRPEAAEFFETVDFTAVDFLIADPERDEVIRKRYGDAVATLVRHDREQNLRRAFRSLPLHKAPPAQRTINVFHLYETYLAKGNLLLLPFRMTWWAIRGTGVLIRRLGRVIHETLHPSVGDEPDEPPETYRAAVRKIHRMRKPAFMESLWLRARFDVEYLGLTIPSVPISVGSDSLMETDLDFIGASRHERVMADRFRNAQRRTVNHCGEWLCFFGWDFEGLAQVLQRDFPHLADRRGEVIRAIVTAWVADHDDIATLGEAIQVLRRVAARAADADASDTGLPEDLPEPPSSNQPLWHKPVKGRRSLEDLLNLPLFHSDDAERRARIHAMFRRHRKALRGWIRVVLGQGGDDPVATLRARIREVMLRTDLWSDQLIVLRMIQTLTMLDLQHYTELVWTLGGYDRLEAGAEMSELPFAEFEPDFETQPV